MSNTEKQYQHLQYRPGSNYRTLWIKGRRIRATVVDEGVHGPEPRTPEEYAEDLHVPLEDEEHQPCHIHRNAASTSSA
jgi:hypothetical protein